MSSATALTLIAIAVLVIGVVQLVFMVGFLILGSNIVREVRHLRAAVDEAAAHVGGAAAQVTLLVGRMDATVSSARQTAISVGALLGAAKTVVQGWNVGGSRRKANVDHDRNPLWLAALRFGMEALRWRRARRAAAKATASAAATGQTAPVVSGTVGDVRRLSQ